MKKSFVFHIIAVCFVLGITLAIFQFYKNENIHEYITPVVAENKDFTIMSGDGRNRQGEKLNVYIYQDKTELSQAVFTNLSYALTYAKVPFKPIMEKEIPSLTPSPYHVLVLTGENVDRWPYDVIRSFVEKGGRVVVTTPLSDAKWNELVGIEKNNGFDSDVSSLTFEETFFPGYPDITKETEFFEDTVLDVQLKKEAQVYITAHDTPILWTYPLKKGEVVYWNTTETIQKHFRGMLLQSIGLATPAFVTSQVAAKVIFIDDFPSPVPEGKNELVTKHYHLSISDFYKQIWWEDMKGWGKEYDLTYTAAFVGTYRNDMKLDDADLVKKGRESMAFYGREVLENNGAIEFHGYNHQPLVTKQDPLDPALRYVPWESQEKMEQSLQRVQKFYESLLSKPNVSNIRTTF